MKNLMVLLTLFLICSAGSVHGDPDRNVPSDDSGLDNPTRVPPNVVRSRAATKELGGALKSALMAAVKEHGVLGAMDVCHDEAQDISKRIGIEQGVLVGRTSDKVRNPANAPDSWEKAGLASFAARIAAGEKARALEMWAVVGDSVGGRQFRYLKAISTMSMCLKCHGDDLADEVAAALKTLYPSDQATGFASGDLRGAFSVTIDLPEVGNDGG